MRAPAAGSAVPAVAASEIPAAPPKVAEVAPPGPRVAATRRPIIVPNPSVQPTVTVGAAVPAVPTMKQAWETEPRDGAWAGLRERELADAFVTAGLDPSIVEVRCQSTTCRVQISMYSLDALGPLNTKMAALTEVLGSNLLPEALPAADGQPPRFMIYLSRKGYEPAQ